MTVVAMLEVAAIALVFLIFSLLSNRLARTVMTAPLFFLGAGLVLASNLISMLDFAGLEPVFLAVGTVALGLSFFVDASRINLSTLRGNISLPSRLLLVGLPLTFLLGTVLAYWLLPALFWVEAALVAIILTPADAGLMTLALSSARVPARIRQTINIESSLNDGLTTPIAAILIALSQTRLGYESIRYRLYYPLEQILISLAVGAAVGGLGGWLLRRAVQKQWMASSFRGLVVPSLTALALAFAAYLGGNQFIACFVGGVALGFFMQTFSQPLTGFAETLTNLLSLVVFLFVGARIIALWQAITWEIVLYALLSLTLVRVLPVAIALQGSGLRRESILFLGWSGPRGLVSIVLGLIVVAVLFDIPHRTTIAATVVTTVSLSVVLHGISGLPLVSWYGRRMEALGAGAPENRPVAEIPFRFGWSHLAAHSDERVAEWEARRAARARAGGDTDDG
jgi:NhaP-type Na+/H+ or K+/H+ antiporter